jgi:hypothetical protein
MNIEDILEIVVIPVTLVVLALLWPAIQAGARRRAFLSLILRELEEVGPDSAEPNRSGWWEHQNKQFVHQKILTDASLNRDFILSLPPELVYFVSQLWAAKEAQDEGQWLHYLQKLSDAEYDPRRKIAGAHQKWIRLCAAYKVKV